MPYKERSLTSKMQGRKKLQNKKELTSTLKRTGVLNYQESKKLGSSVDKFQKEFEMRLKDLSLQQSLLIASQQKRQSRRGSLPSGPTFELLCEEKTKKTNTRTLKNSFSDSAIYQCALRGDVGGKEKSMKLEAKTGASLSTGLKLPSIFDSHKERDAKLIEVEEIKSSSLPDKDIFDKIGHSRQAKPKLEALDMTRKVPSSDSTTITASPPTMRMNRRGSLQVSTLTTEDLSPNRRRVIRRGSCPTLGSKWELARKHFLVLAANKDGEDDEESLFARQAEEMKKCRYLRFPKSILEDEEAEDSAELLTDK